MGSKVTSFVIPAAVIRPALCRIAALYQRELCPLYARTKSPPSTTTVHVGMPYVFTSSRRGEMCRSSVFRDFAQLLFRPCAHGSFSLPRYIRAQQRLNSPPFVHRAVPFRDLAEREHQVKDLARVDLAIENQINQLREVPANRGWAAV